MTPTDDGDLPDFEKLSKKQFDDMLTSGHAKKNIESYIETLIDTAHTHIKHDINQATQKLPPSFHSKEELADFDMDELIPPPNYSKKESDKSTPPSPEKVSYTPPTPPSKPSVETVIDKVTSKKTTIVSRSTESRNTRKAKKKTAPRIKKVGPIEKKSRKSSSTKSTSNEKKVFSDKLKSKTVDSDLMEKRFKERQQKIQDIFDKDKGSLS